MSAPVPQPVVTVADYVDGILTGVAHFNGEPHIFLATEGSPDDPHPRYKLYPIAECDPTFALEPQDLWRPQQAVRDLIASLVVSGRASRIALGDFRPIGPSGKRGPEVMEVLWYAA